MFFDRPESGETAILVHLQLSKIDQIDDGKEFEELVLSAGGDPVELIGGNRSTPHAKYFVGTGKLDELKAAKDAHDAQIVIFNHELSPSQERNLEAVLECRVLDRTGLILDIFAQRARTHEGKLQVELAQLHHMSTRLIRGWTHLERQKGGIGMRGPGETQLETDRRLLRVRIKSIGKRLEKVRKQREQGRRSRSRAEIPVVSLVGYTNAGKSTLFNTITQAGVIAEDKLFATLDPTMRKVHLDEAGAAVLADTVGFISNLPHRLVEAFRATLEEAANADLLLHVIDAADEERNRNIAQVNIVLKEIRAFELPTLFIYNKIDLIEGMQPRIDRNEEGVPTAVWLSAYKNQGKDLLMQALSELLCESLFHETIVLSHVLPQMLFGELSENPEYVVPRSINSISAGKLRAALYQANMIVTEAYNSQGEAELEIKCPEKDIKRLLSVENIDFDIFLQLIRSN